MYSNFQEMLVILLKGGERWEQDTKFDPYVVAIYYKEYKLGFIHREKIVSWVLVCYFIRSEDYSYTHTEK